MGLNQPRIWSHLLKQSLILNGKLHFLCSVTRSLGSTYFQRSTYLPGKNDSQEYYFLENYDWEIMEST